jgi:hypothetical protein
LNFKQDGFINGAVKLVIDTKRARRQRQQPPAGAW